MVLNWVISDQIGLCSILFVLISICLKTCFLPVDTLKLDFSSKYRLLQAMYSVIRQYFSLQKSVALVLYETPRVTVASSPFLSGRTDGFTSYCSARAVHMNQRDICQNLLNIQPIPFTTVCRTGKSILATHSIKYGIHLASIYSKTRKLLREYNPSNQGFNLQRLVKCIVTCYY